MSNLFQDKNTGKLVEFINKHDKEYAMVRDAGGNITYVNIESLVPYDKEKAVLVRLRLLKWLLNLRKNCLKAWFLLKIQG